MSTEKWHHTGQYREKVESVRVSKNRPGDSEKRSNLCEYRKMAESGSVRGKIRIRASVEKLSRGVPEKGRTCVSTEKWRNRGQYGEKVESVRVSKNFPGEYRKKVEIF